MNVVLPLLGLGALGWFVLGKRSPGSSSAPSSGPQPLRAGVRYLFIVRLDPGVTDEQARGVLTPKGVDNLVFAPAPNPPFWATQLGGVATGVWSQRLASFMVAPAGNSTVTLGDPFYGIGRLETLARLDGQPFAAEAPSA